MLSRVFLACVAMFSVPAMAQDNLPLKVASFGGAYARSQVEAFTDPFARATGRWVEMVNYGGDMAALRRQVTSGNVAWDVVDMNATNVIRACREGLLEPLTDLDLPPAPDGTPAAQDFLPDMLQPCGVGQSIWATLVVYDPDAFASRAAPTSLADFFDLNRFPGSRALRDQARVNLEWALLADGVAPESVYQVLGTEAGLERAFAVLDRIRPSIVWWSDGETPIDLLLRRRVAMAAAWSGRVYARAERGGENLEVIWDGHVLEREFWTVPKGSPRRDIAFDFIRFAVDPARQTRQAELIAYSPARRSALAAVSPRVQPYLPTAPQHQGTTMVSDPMWWAENGERIEAAFDLWAAGIDADAAIATEAFDTRLKN